MSDAITIEVLPPMRERPLRARLTWRAKRAVRWAMTRLARPTYSRSLDYLTGRDELPTLLNARGLVGIGAEIGVKEGEFSEEILGRWRGRRLLSVDPWDTDIDRNGDHEDHAGKVLEDLYEATRHRLARFGDRSEIVRSASLEAAATIEPQSLDFVYIDAAHDLESVRQDIAAWYPLIRPGGIIGGHDYLDGTVGTKVWGVRSAVTELCEREGLEVGVTLRDAPCRSWFVQVPGASR